MNLSKINVLIILTLLFFSITGCSVEEGLQNKNSKLIAETVFDSIEFGKIKLGIIKEDNVFLLRINGLSNNKVLAQRVLEFDDDYREDLSQLEIFPVDLNGDKKDDFIILHLYPIGAGPMAGMELERYFAFINSKDRYVKFEKNSLAQTYIDKYKSLNSMEKIKKIYVSLYKGEQPIVLIGVNVDDDKKPALLLLKNEKLIFSFKRVDSSKRVTIGIDQSQKYMVYRYGAPGKVELTYKMERQKKNKFHYIQDDGYGYARYEIRKLNFTINNYTYSIYNNYIESHESAVDGVGVVIKNNKTNKRTVLKGDKTSVYGKLKLLKNIDWLDVSLAIDGERIE